MTKHSLPLSRAAAALAVCGLAALWPASWRPDSVAGNAVHAQPQQPQQQQRTEVDLVITGDSGTPPRYAVPDFVALTPDAAEAARTLGQVLWDDLNFEREFYLIPRDTYATIPPAQAAERVPFASWQELGADAVFFGTVQRSGDTVRVQVRLLNVKTRQSVFAKEYSGSAANPRFYAHTIADEVHQQQRALRGVARTKLAFSSDRTRDRVIGAVPNRDVKEIYIADYDGGNQQRITNTRQLNIMPSWSPDARAIAYTSYRRIEPDIYISRIYQGILENPLKGGGSNYLGVFSPDGSRLAFMSNRDGNPEIYVANRDGSGVRRLTSHPAGDSTPTWSPNGAQIAFTSDRSGQPQIYVMSSADGSGLRRLTTMEAYAEQASWSASLNEIAYAGGTQAHTEIKVLELSTGNVRQITSGSGSSERPTFAPNGRHLAYTTSRNGRTHVFTIARDGKDARQVTTEGNNFSPAWSQ